MQQNTQKTTENKRKATAQTEYAVKREFLGDITAKELVEQIIRLHLSPAPGQKSASAQSAGIWQEQQETQG